MKFSLKGNIPALITPFQKDGKVDAASYKRFIDFQIKGGVDAIVTCGSTGEAATLDTAEYELVVKTAVAAAKKKGLPAGRQVPVIAGAGSNDTKKAVFFSKIAKRLGVDGLLHVTPYYNKPTQSGLVAHFKAIAEAVDLPIILYNVPGRTGSNVMPATILAVVKEVPQVVAVKEASGSITQMMEIVKGAPSDFAVLSGDDALTFPLLALGGVGIISVVSNEIPKAFSDMVHFALEGDFVRARKLHYEWLDLMNANFIESNPIPVKTALAAMGVIKEVFRLPLTPMTPKNKEVLLAVLKKHKLV